MAAESIYMAERSDKHKETFQHTGLKRDSWDLGHLSKHIVAITTEIPVDIMKKMDKIGPWLASQKLIPLDSAYSLTRYAIVIKMIAIDQAARNLEKPDPELMKLLTWDAVNTKKSSGARKNWKVKYRGMTSIPISTGVPEKIGEVMKTYAEMMEKSGMVKPATPYSIGRYCIISVMVELEKNMGKVT